MRPLAALSLVALVVLAGCSVPFADGEFLGNDTSGQSSPAGDSQPATTTTNASDDGGSDTATAGATTGGTTTPAQNIADPPQDVLGWEGGYWYNESIAVAARNGLNASERGVVVNRTMARIETIRELEFTSSVPVRVISRDEFQQRPGGPSGGRSPAFRTFDNAKFEAMFLVGEENNSLAVQRSNRGQNVLGFYSPRNNSIVVISPTETPRLSRSTLSHELVHALQDQQFDLSSSVLATREAYNARNALIEGGANYVQHRYGARCGNDWQCIQTPQNTGGNGSGSADINLGVYLLSFFPYADGPDFVDYVYDRRGWSGVNALYEDRPASTEQVIKPRKYGQDQPTNVTIRDSSSNGWTRVRPGSPGRPDYAILGQSGLSSMFAYTLYDGYNRSSSVVSPTTFLNVETGGINRTDPFDYDLNVTDGWDGDRMYVYRKNNQTAYVWKLTWDSRRDAREFVRGYEQLLAHWGGERVLGRQGVWEVKRNSPYTDAFRITRQGDTVIIVNAPQPGDLSDVHESTG